MTTHRLAFTIRALVLGGVVLVARTVLAQPAAGPIVSGSVAAAIGNDSTNVSFAGFAGYRFNRAFGLGAELTWIPGIERRDDYPIALIYPPFPRFETETDILMFTTNIRIEVPTTSSRILPFVIAGGGLASKTTKTDYGGPIAYATLAQDFDYSGPALIDLPSSFPVRDYGYTQTHLALTIGGGVSILAGRNLSIDVDLREIHLSGGDGGDIGRFGAGVSYRF